MRNGKRNALIMATAAVAGLVRMSYGANVTWQSAPGTSNWNAANWNPAAPVPPTDALFFATSNTTALNNDFVAGTSFASLNFNTGASAFSLSGNSANFTGGVVLNQANSALESINFGFTAGGSIAMGTDQSAANSLAVNENSTAGGLFVNSNSATANTLSIAANKILTINGTSTIGFTSAATTAPNTSLTVTGNELDANGNFIVGLAETGTPRDTNTANLSGLNTFKLTASTSTGVLGIGSAALIGRSTLILASSNSPNSLNTIQCARQST